MLKQLFAKKKHISKERFEVFDLLSGNHKVWYYYLINQYTPLARTQWRNTLPIGTTKHNNGLTSFPFIKADIKKPALSGRWFHPDKTTLEFNTNPINKEGYNEPYLDSIRSKIHILMSGLPVRDVFSKR